MNKKIIILLFLLSSALHGKSQITWNITAGMNFSRITNLGNDELKPGYQLGVGVDYYFNNHWGVQSGLMLISKGHKITGDYTYLMGWTEEKRYKSFQNVSNRTYVEIPVMIAYRFNISQKINLVLNGGGYVSYGIAGKTTNKYRGYERGESIDKRGSFSSEVNKFDTGFSARATIEYKNKYTIGLMGDWGVKSYVRTLKNQTYGLNLGYKF